MLGLGFAIVVGKAPFLYVLVGLSVSDFGAFVVWMHAAPGVVARMSKFMSDDPPLGCLGKTPYMADCEPNQLPVRFERA